MRPDLLVPFPHSFVRPMLIRLAPCLVGADMEGLVRRICDPQGPPACIGVRCDRLAATSLPHLVEAARHNTTFGEYGQVQSTIALDASTFRLVELGPKIAPRAGESGVATKV